MYIIHQIFSWLISVFFCHFVTSIPKPRKRRSLASRIAGHVDLEGPDLLSSPLHTLTFAPGKDDSPKIPKMDTELQLDIPGTSDSPKHPEMDTELQEEILSTSIPVPSRMPSATSSRVDCSKMDSHLQLDIPGTSDSPKSPKMDTELQEEIPSTSIPVPSRMPSATLSRGGSSKAVTQKPRSSQDDETDLDKYAANILLAMQGLEYISPEFDGSMDKGFSEIAEHGGTSLEKDCCFTNNERIVGKN